MPRSATFKTTLAFVGVALICLPFADLEIITLHPWIELGRMALGVVTPNFLARLSCLSCSASIFFQKTSAPGFGFPGAT